MTTPPGNYPITLYQGASFAQTITWKDETQTLINLIGYTARMQARETIASGSPFLELTTENDGIVLDGAGQIALFMSATATCLLPAIQGYYDLELVAPDGRVYRLLEGSLTISPEVTR